MFNSIRKYFFLLLPLIFIFSCASKEERLEKLIQIKNEIDPKLDYEKGIDAIHSTDTTLSKFRFYYLDDELAFINEDLQLQNEGRGFSKYYFKDGELFYYIGNRKVYEDVNGKLGAKSLTRWEFYLEGKDTLSFFKTVNSRIDSLRDWEFDFILSHAEDLKEKAEEKYSQRN